MSGIGPKVARVEPSRMDGDDRLLWGGVALIIVGGALLFGPVALGMFLKEVATVAVLGLAAGAVLVGLSETGRPV